jgi:nicotinamidase-related amidase
MQRKTSPPTSAPKAGKPRTALAALGKLEGAPRSSKAARPIPSPRQTPKVIRIKAKPFDVEMNMSQSALVIVDMQNDFLHPEGWFAQKGIETQAVRQPIPKINQFLRTWRAHQGHVIWLNWGVRSDLLNLPKAYQRKAQWSGGQDLGVQRFEAVGYAMVSAIDHGPSLVQGSWGAKTVEDLSSAPSDILVYKHRLSGFWDNELDSILRSLGVKTLVFAGINTDRCVFSTLQDGGFLGYECILLKDLCATSSPEYVSQAIYFLVEKLHGFTASANALIKGLEPPAKPKHHRTHSE